MNYTEQQAEWITQQILQELATSKKTAAPAAAPVALNIPVGVSNRHVHLCREDMDILFGYGSTLTRSKALKQPGQYAAEEMVTLRGPKGELNKVRVLGPLRNATQVEISVADGFALGTKAPVRMSGDLLDSPGIEIIGPKGRVAKHNGMIVAWRHIHISPEEAELHGLHDGMEIDVQTNGPRGGVLSHVVVRVTADAVLELHIDMEEANGVGLRNGDTVRGIKQAARHG
ncbi:Propanediol utilization protein [Escherichia coli]